MDKFFEMNPGISSRITYRINFPYFTLIVLLNIHVNKLKTMNTSHKISREALKETHKIILKKKDYCYSLSKPFGNARYIDNVANLLHTTHAVNYINKTVSDNVISIADVNGENYST